MPSNAELNAYMLAQQQLKAAAVAELRSILSALAGSPPVTIRNTLIEVMPALIAKYGDVMGAISAEFFEGLIGGRVQIAGLAEPAAFWASTRWAVDPVFKGAAIGAVAPRLEGTMTRHILQVGRDTVANSSSERGVAWARVLKGSKNCAFCVTMAGRGAVYESKSSAATAKKRPGRAFHDDCDCQIVPIRDDRDWPEGYDHERLEKMYADARASVDSAQLKGGKAGVPRELVPDEDLSILQKMRKDYGLT